MNGVANLQDDDGRADGRNRRGEYLQCNRWLEYAASSSLPDFGCASTNAVVVGVPRVTRQR